jgi:hypothetical protein
MALFFFFVVSTCLRSLVSAPGKRKQAGGLLVEAEAEADAEIEAEVEADAAYYVPLRRQTLEYSSLKGQGKQEDKAEVAFLFSLTSTP